MSIHLRIISLWTVFFGMIGAAIGVLSARNPIFGAITWALAAGMVGMFLGIVLIKDHWSTVRRITNEVTAEALDLSHTRTVYIPLPYVSAYKLAEAMVRFIENARIDQADLDQGIICATIDINERRGYTVSDLRVELRVLDETRTEIVVDCRPKAKWLPFPDFGYNLALIQRITRFLESMSEVSAGR